jgi:predicted dehydrogenase
MVRKTTIGCVPTVTSTESRSIEAKKSGREWKDEGNTMSDVRIGLIGFGAISGQHAHYLAAGDVQGGQLGAICDGAQAACERAKNLYPSVPFYESPEAMMASGEVDGVLIATPHFSHPALAMQAMRQGLHVMTEKPAGAHTQQVRELNEAARKSDRVFGIMYNERTNGIYQKMRELVQAGELGEIKRTHYVVTDWYRTQAYYDSGGWRATWGGEGGGVLLNQSPHNLDAWQWICGMPKRVRAFCGFGRYHDIEVEDDVTAYVEYENGATGVFITSTGELPGSKLFEIVGDRGKLKMEDDKLTFWRSRESIEKHTRCSNGAAEHPEIWKCELPTTDGTAHTGITQDWVRAIKNGTPQLAPGIEGIHAVELCNAMLLSAWTDDWVNLPLDDELYYRKLREKVQSSARYKAEW